MKIGSGPAAVIPAPQEAGSYISVETGHWEITGFKPFKPFKLFKPIERPFFWEGRQGWESQKTCLDVLAQSSALRSCVG